MPEASATPTVSVLLPAFNASAFLRSAVASVLSQSLSDLELIIVDDASQDDTLDLARSIAMTDSRVQVLANETRRGPAGARNAALAQAKGIWIALLDADDTYLPHRLERLVEQARDRDCDFLADNLILVEPSKSQGLEAFEPAVMARTQPLSAQAFVLLDAAPPQGRRPLGYCKPIIRRDFVLAHDLSYDTRAFRGQDFVFYFTAITRGARFYLTPEALYRFTIGHASHSTGLEALKQIAATNERLLREAQGTGRAVTAALRERRAKFRFEVFRADLRQRSFTRAAAAVLQVPPRYLLRKILAALSRRLAPEGGRQSERPS